jgi:hypothetical protein
MEVDGAPDLTDFMNDWFFGTVGAWHSGGGYDLTGESSKRPASPAGKKQGKSGGGRRWSGWTKRRGWSGPDLRDA